MRAAAAMGAPCVSLRLGAAAESPNPSRRLRKAAPAPRHSSWGFSRISKPMEKIGEGGAKSTPVKLGAGGDCDGSLDRVVSIGRSRLRVDHLGQFYDLDSEDEGTDTEVELYVPDSEGEVGDGHGCRRGDVARGYNRGHAVVASLASKVAKEMTMVGNPGVEVGTGVDPAREVAKVVDPPLASPTVADLPAKVGTSGAPVVEGTTVQAAVDVPVGAATADELHPEVDQLFKIGLIFMLLLIEVW
uniref:Uncharacterized protein n=1 Tax=Saccharum spontaneum TaxID=62335 RepID=A0A678T4M0_SACSP|nr:hypothetical protein SS11P21_000007 [Saccharum spontaneum]